MLLLTLGTYINMYVIDASLWFLARIHLIRGSGQSILIRFMIYSIATEMCVNLKQFTIITIGRFTNTTSFMHSISMHSAKLIFRVKSIHIYYPFLPYILDTIQFVECKMHRRICEK